MEKSVFEVIAELKKLGVTKAQWHEDGSLASIEILPLEKVQDTIETPKTFKVSNDEILLNPYIGI